MDANRDLPGYKLTDELARFCLPAMNRDHNRTLAWTNSICILFLFIGVAGWRRAADFVEPPPPVGDRAAVILEPLAQPPTTDENENQEQTDADKAETPQVVAVALNTPAINFAVPAPGNLVVPAALAIAPPAAPLKIAVSRIAITSTGAGGERPQPPYPKIALDSAQQGSVILSMTVDETGVINSIEVRVSSGWPILDRATLEFVKRHWLIPPMNGTRLFEATVTYKLTVN